MEEKNVPAILLLSNIYYEKGVVKEIPYMIEHLKELSDKADHIQAQYTLGEIYLKESMRMKRHGKKEWKVEIKQY